MFWTALRSRSMRRAMLPKMEIALKSETSIVPITAVRPIVAVASVELHERRKKLRKCVSPMNAPV